MKKDLEYYKDLIRKADVELLNKFNYLMLKKDITDEERHKKADEVIEKMLEQIQTTNNLKFTEGEISLMKMTISSVVLENICDLFNVRI